MNLAVLCVVIFSSVISSEAVYNKDVICVIDKEGKPECTTKESSSPYKTGALNLPTYDPYIPRDNVIFYNCTSTLDCRKVTLNSITEVSNPSIQLNECFAQSDNGYNCEELNYNHLKNVDKLLFLSKNIVGKSFYIVDCLVQNSTETKVCTRRDDVYSHEKVVDTGAMVNAEDQSALSLEDFICEQDKENNLFCDHNKYVPYSNGVLKIKDSSDEDAILKSGSKMFLLKYNCLNGWCGHIGQLSQTRRHNYPHYSHEDPGGKTFVCYYANRAQACKEVDEKKPKGFLLNTDY